MENQITIKYPYKMPDAMHLTKKQFEQEAKIAIFSSCFKQSKIS